MRAASLPTLIVLSYLLASCSSTTAPLNMVTNASPLDTAHFRSVVVTFYGLFGNCNRWTPKGTSTISHDRLIFGWDSPIGSGQFGWTYSPKTTRGFDSTGILFVQDDSVKYKEQMRDYANYDYHSEIILDSSRSNFQKILISNHQYWKASSGSPFPALDTSGDIQDSIVFENIPFNKQLDGTLYGRVFPSLLTPHVKEWWFQLIQYSTYDQSDHLLAIDSISPGAYIVIQVNP